MISDALFSGVLEPPRIAAEDASPATVPDAELVRRSITGDDAAFAEIVSRYRGKMFGIALSLVRCHADAEEIVQDTFICAHRGLAGFRGESSLGTWLHRIAFNRSRNRYWRLFRRQRHEACSLDCPLGEDSDTTLADLAVSDSPTPVREAANREFYAHVTACMGKLSAHQREILSLRDFSGHSYEKIAETLGLSMGTVKSRIARARKNLCGLLTQACDGFEPGLPPFSRWFEPSRLSGRLESVYG